MYKLSLLQSDPIDLILTKLKSDLTPEERQSLLNRYLSEPQTLELVRLKWKSSLTDQEISIEQIKQAINSFHVRCCKTILEKTTQPTSATLSKNLAKFLTYGNKRTTNDEFTQLYNEMANFFGVDEVKNIRKHCLDLVEMQHKFNIESQKAQLTQCMVSNILTSSLLDEVSEEDSDSSFEHPYSP